LTTAAGLASRPATGEADALLAVDGLRVDFRTDAGRLTVLDGVTFSIKPGETLALVGESGSGKSVTAMAIMGLVRHGNGRIRDGSVRLEGRDLVPLSEKELSRVRGGRIGMIFQEPRRSLDPAFSVGGQIADVAARHLGLSRRAARQRAVEMLDRVGIPSAARRARDYPHMFSGGMCQRVMLAMALVAEPRLLIADEPTTALDVTVQAKVLRLLRDLQNEIGLSVLMITHDLGVVAENCDRVAVMYAGQIVESAPAPALLGTPTHPYTAGLLASLPQTQQPGERLVAIRGAVPAPGAWPEGCRFHPRCDHAVPGCSAAPVPLWEEAESRRVRCARAGELTLRGLA
jgi:oligopeptide/dipeptide ABC transporter ATP-binding protein